MAAHWIIFIILSCIAFLFAFVFQRAEYKAKGNQTFAGIGFITWIIIGFYINCCLIWGGFFWW